MSAVVRAADLPKVDQILASFAENPERLSRARDRFNRSPRPNRFEIGTTTPRGSPFDDESWQRMKRHSRLWLTYWASQPCSQFSAQVREVKDRIKRGEINKSPEDSSNAVAADIVKKCWIEQGIWDYGWIGQILGRWKHEEPLTSPPRLQTSTEPASDKLQSQLAAEDIRSREASRPFHQFIYQVSQERERITAKQPPITEQPLNNIAADINTIAYENVKQVWIRRRIWNSKWGLLPGMTWKHEHPFDEEDEEGDDVVDQDHSEPQSCDQSTVLAVFPDPVLSPRSISSGQSSPYPAGRQPPSPGKTMDHSSVLDRHIPLFNPFKYPGQQTSPKGVRAHQSPSVAAEAASPPTGWPAHCETTTVNVSEATTLAFDPTPSFGPVSPSEILEPNEREAQQDSPSSAEQISIKETKYYESPSAAAERQPPCLRNSGQLSSRLPNRAA
ncbi:hypothetical protein E4U43_005353 [Claviceps pusilla]|uniref:Uncharacterized protein n=1 Tax=Claviceps pusilla TaxID=123648 RepID=A0A9P7NEG7_9HYPO|nr:hypothetical protein E4U43_005353 [Claviceps pusilla]